MGHKNSTPSVTSTTKSVSITTPRGNFNSVASSDPYSGLDKLYNPNSTQMGVDNRYNDIEFARVNSVDQCANGCYNNNNCVGFVTNAAGNQCWLKSNFGNAIYNQDRNSYTINRNNSFSDYIQYDNLVLNDGSNKQELTNVPLDCVTSCINNPNCRGLNIIMNTGENEVSVDGYNYQDTPKVTCEYVSNICYSNTQTTNPNSKFFAKKNNLHFENNTPYLLKNNGVCLTGATSRGSYVGWDCNEASIVEPVVFDTANDMISLQNDPNRCLATTNNNEFIFDNCNVWDSKQKFIYDHVYNTLRPLNDTTQCVTTTNIPQGDGSPLYHFGMAPCGNPTPENNTTFENYYKPDPKEDNIEYFENDYSVDMGYYIVYMILLCMIAYLVIVSSSKK